MINGALKLRNSLQYIVDRMRSGNFGLICRSTVSPVREEVAILKER